MILNDNTADTAGISNILESSLNDNLVAKFLIRYDDKVCANVVEQFNGFLCKGESCTARSKGNRPIRQVHLVDSNDAKHDNVVCWSC